jgi:uncharacterized iron-regulated protein
MIRALALCLSLLIPLPALAEPLPGPAALRGAEVVILGEVHDNPAHHLWQAEALAALSPAAVVFEMLTPGQAGRITPDLLAEPGRLPAVLEWEASGWPDFALYEPVFAALGDAMVYGAALPYGEVRAAVAEGAAARFAGDAARFGLTRALPQDQQALREALQAEAHCDALPPELLPGMVEAQRLRDAAFAQTVLQALAETGGPVVLITGNGHARTDWAVPAIIALAAPDVGVVSVGQLEEPAGEERPFDYWRVTVPAPREDPCAAFR